MTIDILSIIKAEFNGKGGMFSKSDLIRLLKRYLPTQTNESTLGWRIHDLKEKGAITHLGRNIYSLSAKQGYLPAISKEATDLYNDLKLTLPFTSLCIIETSWFNEFMLHQVFKNYLLIEVEKEAASSVFNKLSDEGKKVFLNPKADMFENYISGTDDAIIVKSLISESPLSEQNGITIATLEKLLVDMICDKETYAAQRQEFATIFANAAEKYNINKSKMKRYARRRNRLSEINTLIDLT